MCQFLRNVVIYFLSVEPLKPGDAVKVKFGSRWYNAEVSEQWLPRQSKKGNYIFQLLFTLISRIGSMDIYELIWPF